MAHKNGTNKFLCPSGTKIPGVQILAPHQVRARQGTLARLQSITGASKIMH